MEKKTKSIILGVVIVSILLLAGLAYLIFVGLQKAGEQINEDISNVNDAYTNAAVNSDLGVSNSNVNGATAVLTNQSLESTGTVFIKGVKTPSESYGILTSDGAEIGFEAYDSRKEEFRPYVGDKISITFSDVCRSSTGDCCRTLFYYCGTIDSWEPIEE